VQLPCTGAGQHLLTSSVTEKLLPAADVVLCECSGDGLRSCVLRELGVGGDDVEMVVSAVHVHAPIPSSLRTARGRLRRRRISESMTPAAKHRAVPARRLFVVPRTTLTLMGSAGAVVKVGAKSRGSYLRPSNTSSPTSLSPFTHPFFRSRPLRSN